MSDARLLSPPLALTVGRKIMVLALIFGLAALFLPVMAARLLYLRRRRAVRALRRRLSKSPSLIFAPPCPRSELTHV